MLVNFWIGTIFLNEICLLLKKLDEFGLKNFVKFKGYWSVEVIRTFYTNLEYRIRDRTIYSEVRGKNIILDEIQFAEVLGLPTPEFTAHVLLITIAL